LVLLGGEPGIGKSTLLLQIAEQLSQAGKKVLYISGEESDRQIKMRGERLGIQAQRLYLLSETCLERIFEECANLLPDAVIVDSVQTIYSLKLDSAPGTISQVREVAAQFLLFAKGHTVPVFLIGHITKEGAIAGPKALEHIVDAVLYFEGERHHNHRVVRAVKNRFGAANEVGVFEMTEAGLQGVENPSRLFLAERPVAVGLTVAAIGILLVVVRTIGARLPLPQSPGTRNLRDQAASTCWPLLPTTDCEVCTCPPTVGTSGPALVRRPISCRAKASTICSSALTHLMTGRSFLAVPAAGGYIDRVCTAGPSTEGSGSSSRSARTYTLTSIPSHLTRISLVGSTSRTTEAYGGQTTLAGPGRLGMRVSQSRR